MTAPFLKYGAFGDEVSLVLAFLVGIGFGFALERAGFGSARKLVSQFYLDDLAVFKVMFTAIVTAMLGVTFLSWAGFLDLSLVYLSPTYLVPQVIGGLVLGAGFVIGGYCPGTSVAAAATGRLDGLVLVAGVLAGTLLFAEAYPLVKAVHGLTPMGPLTIPQFFDLPHGVVVFAVVLVAVGGFAGAGWVERWVASRRATSTGAPASRSPRLLNRRLAVAAVALGLVAIAAQPTRAGRVTVPSRDLALSAQRGADQVSASELADWIVAGRADFRLIDLRDEAAFAAYRIPNAEHVPIARLLDAPLSRNETIVLCADDGVKASQAWFLLKANGYHGAYMLTGGLEGWKTVVLFPRLRDGAGADAQRENDLLRARAERFGGRPLAAATAGADATLAPPPPLPPAPLVAAPLLPGGGAKPAARKRREGC
jgi:rhodanese-related sulfurtransferase